MYLLNAVIIHLKTFVFVFLLVLLCFTFPETGSHCASQTCFHLTLQLRLGRPHDPAEMNHCPCSAARFDDQSFVVAVAVVVIVKM